MERSEKLLEQYNELYSQSFCVLPWLHRFTDLDGGLHLCCIARGGEGHLRDDHGRKLYIQHEVSEQELFNTEHVRGIRKDMLEGKWPEACKQCLVTESTGRESRRIVENKRFQHDIPWIIDNTQDDGSAPVRITSRDYRPGNLCNLRCRMCSPDASVQLIDEFNLIRRRKLSDAENDAFRNIDWFKNPKVWDTFREHVHELEHLHFAGGEPLFTPEVQKAMEICVEEGAAKNIEVTFNTNMTLLPEKMLSLWPKFRGITLMCSIDGFGAVNDFIRHPARWKVIEKNLQRIDKDHKALNVIGAQLNTTVQIYNIFRLHELVEYGHENFKFITPMPSMVYLTEPYYFNTQVLPAEMKERVKENLQALEDKLRSQGVTEGFDELRGQVTYMNQGSSDARWISDFRRVTAIFDRSRRQKMVEVLPELAPLMRFGPQTLLGQAQCWAAAAQNVVGRFQQRLGLKSA